MEMDATVINNKTILIKFYIFKVINLTFIYFSNFYVTNNLKFHVSEKISISNIL